MDLWREKISSMIESDYPPRRGSNVDPDSAAFLG